MESCKCCYDNPLYPDSLRNIKNAPSIIHYNGDISILNDQLCIAIIGSREASPQGLKYAYRIGKMAAENGFVVVNGLAVGCDSEALRGAISVHGKCVAVMPCGVDYVYPSINKSLSAGILAEGGCLISEYDDGTKPQRHYFVKRDRIQSGISQGIIVIETGISGGTMHTVKYAQMQQKRLAVYYNKLMQLNSGNKQIVENNIGVPVDDDESVLDYFIALRTSRIEEGQQMFLNLT